MHRGSYISLAAAFSLVSVVGCANANDIDLPNPAVSAAEQDYPEAPLLEAIEECMNDQGWEIIVDPAEAGYSGPEMSPELSAQWIQASNACAEEVGYFDPQLNLSQQRELYEQEVSTHECIVALGQPSDRPPTEQVYLDTYGTGDQYFAIGALAAAQMPIRDVALQCPPPTWFLNVSGLG